MPAGAHAGRARELAQKHFESLGIALFETCLSWWASHERIRSISHVEGREHLEAALAKGKGAILLSAHFTTLEIGARILATMMPINIMYRPTKNELLAYFLARNRGRLTKRAIRRDDVRTLVTALRSNEVVWYAPDQSYRKKGAEMVRLFGIPAATNTATSRLAGMTGAAMLPYFVERLPGAQGYRAVIHPRARRFSERLPGRRCRAVQPLHRAAGAARARAISLDPPALQGTQRRLSGLLFAAGIPRRTGAGQSVTYGQAEPIEHVDVLVVGGGINGTGIARDAAGRGLSVLLCEQDDLASHTSSASTKLIHGGLRYLEGFHFALVRKALQEREVLLASAPHIMWPLRFVMPHDAHLRPQWMIRAGLFLYDNLAKRDGSPPPHRSTCASTRPARRSSRNTRAASSTRMAGRTMRASWCSMRAMRPIAEPTILTRTRCAKIDAARCALACAAQWTSMTRVLWRAPSSTPRDRG